MRLHVSINQCNPCRRSENIPIPTLVRRAGLQAVSTLCNMGLLPCTAWGTFFQTDPPRLVFYTDLPRVGGYKGLPRVDGYKGLQDYPVQSAKAKSSSKQNHNFGPELVTAAGGGGMSVEPVASEPWPFPCRGELVTAWSRGRALTAVGGCGCGFRGSLPSAGMPPPVLR